jgi:poly-beta-1,6-N-acetyl-D-glucosamine synthase
MMNAKSYVIISPAKNESRYIEFTLRSIIAQSVRPAYWIIVDDGSSDSTPEIVKNYGKEHPWIKLLSLPNIQGRNPGPAGVRAFEAGRAVLPDIDYKYLVKLDSDLELPHDYFERLLHEFDSDPKLGIASGSYLENWTGTWQLIDIPEYHAVGASKVMRRECFEDFGGYSATLGWDTIDEIRAQRKGWKTGHFQEPRFRHLRLEGSAQGYMKTYCDNGETDYLLGVGFGFFFLKVCQRLLIWRRPLGIRGLALFWGYASSFCRRVPKLATPEESSFYRSQLNSRMAQTLRRLALRGKSSRLRSGILPHESK